MASNAQKMILGLAAGVAFAAVMAAGGCTVQGAGGGITREQGDTIIAELKEIRRTLADQKAHGADKVAAHEASDQVVIDDSNRQVLGASEARVTLVEFTDYQCPFCKRFHDRSWPEIKAKYIDTGKVRYIVRDLPLDIHSEAMPAAIAARCAGEQGKFWPVHEALFNATPANPLSPNMIKLTVATLGVMRADFERCSADPATKAAISADIAEAERIGVTGTPGFVLGKRNGTKIEGTLILGSQPTEVFTSRFDTLLKETAPKAP
jgi:protein-disulfide isomerase